MMRFLIISLLALLIATLSQTAISDQMDSSKTGNCSGIWASSGKQPYVGPDFAPGELLAPDGTVSIKVIGDGISLVGRKHGVRLRNIFINPRLMEVLWSPDSKNFVVNVSDGGFVGTWDTYFYSVDQDEYPVSRDIESLVRPIANNLPQCDPEEEANIGAVAWLNHGKELLLVAEVPPHSSCRNMGDILGFRIAVDSWSVIEQIPKDELRKNWVNVLGCRLVSEVKDHP